MIQQFHFLVYTKRTERRILKRYCTPMFVTLFITAKRRKPPKCLWVGKQNALMYLQWYMRAVEYYLTEQKLMKLEDIILTEII